MRILSWYIVREHIAPFLFAFFIITFLLVIQFVPKIIDRIIDKNLDPIVVLELIGLNLAWMLALSVPMAVLVATLMAFGRLSGDFEIIAIKASGINMLHVLIPLLFVGTLLTFGMVQFHDKVLPDLNKRARTLLGDIQAMRPTLVFDSGVFISDIPGYLVLIDKIDHKTSFVQGVRITETRDPQHPRIIIAKNGYLKMTDGGRNMRFTLNDGELHTLDLENPENYRKLNFQHQVINIAGPDSELRRSDSDYRTDREMNIKQMEEHVQRAMETAGPLRFRINDYLKKKFDYLYGDTFHNPLLDTLTFSAALKTVKQDADVMVQHVERNQLQIDAQQRIMDKYEIEIYKKFSIPAASLAFILIGAPLGILTKRGGIGAAITVAILMFIVYWVFLIGGEDMADRGLVSPFWAMWSANILMGIIGVYLNYKVVTEKPVLAFLRKVF